MKRVQHKKVQNEKSSQRTKRATGKKCNMKRMEKKESASRKERNTENVQHENSVT